MTYNGKMLNCLVSFNRTLFPVTYTRQIYTVKGSELQKEHSEYCEIWAFSRKRLDERCLKSRNSNEQAEVHCKAKVL
jgi:hypothetical protein